MRKSVVLIFLSSLLINSCKDTPPKEVTAPKRDSSITVANKAKNTSTELSCKLSSPELRKRKAVVLAQLRKQMLERKELSNGFAFKFPGTDSMVTELTEFIKTERTCCDFFIFTLSVSGDKTEAWLELTGVEGAKEFIVNELEL
ncbi:MAG TPA: hypothetical protein VFO76_07685 [Candidatus Kapabacteria bacterium]|nr:hypothetical protein [Candidatus Kapabacteria bacterium]